MENRIKTVLLLAGMTVFLIFMGKILGGRQGMYIAFILAVGMNFFSYWFSDKIVLKHVPRPGSEPGGRAPDAPDSGGTGPGSRHPQTAESISFRMSLPMPLPRAATPSTPRWRPPKASCAS